MSRWTDLSWGNIICTSLKWLWSLQQSVHVLHITSKHPAFPNPSIAWPKLSLSPSIMHWAVCSVVAGSLFKARTLPGIYLPPDSHSKRQANKESHQWPRACWCQVSPLVTVSGFPLCWKPTHSLKAQSVAIKRISPAILIGTLCCCWVSNKVAC